MDKKPDFYSKKRRINNLYKITNYNSQSVTFQRNEAQIYIQDKTIEWRKNNPGKPLRRIILKGRQQGITTDSCITNLDDTLIKRNRNVAIVAHKLDKQKEIFKKVQYAYDHFLVDGGIKLSDGKVFRKPKTKLENVNQLFFKNINSQIHVTLDARSGTYSALHITELAFRNDAEEMMSGTLPAALNADITIETTANGVGNYFHNLWKDNYNNPDGEWLCIFLPWRLTARYNTPLKEGEVLRLPEDLLHLNNIKCLSDGQKNWYYRNWKTLKRKMFQEYPSSPEEAFLNSGDTVRDPRLLRQLPTLEYTIDDVYRDLRIYRPPEQGSLYLCGIDTAEGGPNGDFSAFTVRDINMDLYASFYSRIPPDKLKDVVSRLFDLGYICVLNPERNNTGIALINKIKEDPLLVLFLVETETVDKKTNTTLQYYGWHTNSKTRVILTGEYEEAIREGYITEFDDRHKAELYTFVYDNRKKMVASSGNHDDFIMGDGITYQTRNFYYKYYAFTNSIG